MVKRLKVSILGLVETRVKQENLLKIHAAMVPGWEVIHNYSAHRLGRIWLCWDPNQVSIHPMHIHAQSITCKVTLVDQSSSWLLTIVYGATQGIERMALFQELLFVKG
jgi:hypothetical protein